jgi:hypothetical protein
MLLKCMTIKTSSSGTNVSEQFRYYNFFLLDGPIYLQSVIIHSANGGKGEGCLVEEYSVALLC